MRPLIEVFEYIWKRLLIDTEQSYGLGHEWRSSYNKRRLRCLAAPKADFITLPTELEGPS